MHEMGIVIHLAKTLDELAEEHNITKIGSVTLSVGEVSGIVNDLFIDAWEYFKKKHPILSDSELRMEVIPAVTHCDGCGEDYETVAHGKICPHCGSKETWLIQGNECIIKEIEAETAPEEEDPDAGSSDS
ncbi:MAG: hydrogenase maturation nickel metallochaperone HypA [Firmicutes bacterium]|nr:hydrogenase maturation nickel metallochaperone HypA [Bacillota bacterium]